MTLSLQLHYIVTISLDAKVSDETILHMLLLVLVVAKCFGFFLCLLSFFFERKTKKKIEEERKKERRKMVTISFALICRKNPSITDVDDIQNITKLDLDNSKISVIDNLEIFNHIRELNLSHNKIKSLRNLEYLTSLDVLDLSCNELSSADLLSSMQFLPKQLSTIVLSANPCAEDEIALGHLQELFPSLGIAIDEVDENDMESDNVQNDPNDEDNSTNENEVLPSADTDPVNVDEVLKYIVDRKCKLQSLQSFDLDSIVKVSWNSQSATVSFSNCNVVLLICIGIE